MDPSTKATILRLVLVFVLLCSGFVGYMLLCIFRKRQRLEQAVREELELFRTSAEDFSQRFSLLEEHAIDYMNSLGAEGTRLLRELREIRRSTCLVLEQAQAHLAEGSYESLVQAGNLLRFTLAPSATAEHESFGARVLGKEWEETAEELLQELGRELAEASAAAERIGIPKRRKRLTTKASLSKAKIITPEEPKQS